MTVIFSVLLSILLAVLAVLGRNERLPRNAFYGFRTEKTMDSEQAWVTAHRAAAPANAVASLCFAGTAIVAGFIVNSTRAESVSAIVGWIAGFLALGAAIYLAQRSAGALASD